MGAILFKGYGEPTQMIEQVEKEIQYYECSNHYLLKQKEFILDNFLRLALAVYIGILMIFMSFSMGWKIRAFWTAMLVLLPFSLSCSHCAIKWWYEDRLESYLEKLEHLYEQKDDLLKNIFNNKMNDKQLEIYDEASTFLSKKLNNKNQRQLRKCKHCICEF